MLVWIVMQTLFESIERLKKRLDISLKIQVDSQVIVLFPLEPPHFSKMTDIWIIYN